MPSAIVCDALTRNFGAVRAVDGLSLAVPEGSVFAFLGPNGAGKTTTIHLLLGVLEPTSGSARVVGFDPTQNGAAVRRHCGALLEHSGLYERLSARQNLAFYAAIAHLDRDEAGQRIAELLTRFGLYERRHDAVGTWSRGMKQKLTIARVLLHRPSLVFLDEPTAGLDPEATVALRRDITSLAENEGATVFLTTHNLTDAEKMATRVAVVRSGRVLDCGTPAELRRRGVRTRVTIRMDDREDVAIELAPGERVAPIVSRLAAEGAQIEEVRRDEPTLEDVFLRLVRSEGTVANDDRHEAMVAPSKPQNEIIGRDILTIVRKEWRETLGSGSRATIAAGIVMLAIVGVLASFAGERIVRSPAMLSATSIAFLILLGTVADSFAGERERHTLETLVASAIPDAALLLGKILASVVYGWGATLLMLAVVLLGANIAHPGVLYPPSTLLAALVLTPLLLLFLSTTGVWLSLRSPTVRSAQTRITAVLFGLLIPFVALRPFLPRGWRHQAIEMLRSDVALTRAIAMQCLIFLALDLVLLTLAAARFRRSRLI
jgi:ABC-2 type transport system ATP-binding protein